MKKNYFDCKDNKIFPLKPLNVIVILLIFLVTNIVTAQCNGSSGNVLSNVSNMCVGGSTEQFWSTGWAGGIWSSSNSSVLMVEQNTYNGNATVTAIASGTADVLYTYRQAGCPDKISRKTITVGTSVGAVSADQFICTGNSLSSNITIASASGTVQWKRADNAAFTTNIVNVGTNSTTLTVAQVGVLTATRYFRAVVTGGTCGLGTSGIVTVTVSPASVGGSIIGSTSVCSGTNSTVLTLSGHTGNVTKWQSSPSSTFASSITDISNTTTSLTATNLTGTTYFRAVVQSGSCSTANSTVATVTVGPTTVGGAVTGGTTICSGSTSGLLTLSGHTGSVVKWQSSISPFATWTDISNTSTTYTSGFLFNTTQFRAVVVSGGCTSYSTATTVTINTTSEPTGNATQYFCSGATVANLSATGAGIKWYAVSSGGTALASTTVLVNGTHYYATQTVSGCESTTRFDVTARINSAPTITPNKVDETCSTSNNGSISPVLSGGLSNIRYIKLTQKFVDPDAWQQVQEIQALEIFTGTNVALASNGATAASTNTYQSNTAVYGPQKAIDGDFTGYSFWHSNSTNINESITVTLQAAKNIDYLRIYNRTDCCSVRGQNMLLELFDASNTLVYSRTVDLRGATGTENYVEVNVLDVSWSPAYTTSLNRTGLDSGTYTLNYSDVVGCSTSSAINIASVNTSPAITSMTTSSCSAVGFTATPVNSTNGVVPSGTTYSWSAPSVTGITGTASGTNATNISGNLTNTTNAAINVVYTVTPTSGSCTGSTFTVTVTVNPRPATPTVGTITQPTCAVPTGSVVLNGLPSSGSWTITPNTSGLTGLIGTGTTTTITGLTAGTSYTFTVSNGSCSSSTITNVVIDNIPATKTWNGTWSPAGEPTIQNRIVFDADFTSYGDVEGCSCQVNTGKKVVFKSVGANSGNILKVTNQVTVIGTGTLTFENNASLIQTNDAAPANSGNIKYHRHTAPVKRYDYTYWSSPVVGQTLYDLSPNTLGDKYYSYDPDLGWQISYDGIDIMAKGRGYIIRAPQYFDINTAEVDINPVFIGTPNNGVITLPSLAVNRVHLLGNPYPSAIDAEAFIDFNSSVLEGTLYFWTHNSPPVSSGSTTYSYTANDYATYNKTGLAITKKAAVTGINVPTGKIAAGQGFFAPVKLTGDVIFNNAMRTSGGVSGTDNSQFFKLSGTSKTATTTSTREKNRVWLNLTNKEGVFKQTLIGYITGATNDYDGGFDGVTYDANPFVDFYSVNNQVNLVIQGRALPFVKIDSVALGYKSTIEGEFQISIDHTDGALATQKIFLEDQDLKVLHDLKKEPYTFSTEKGIFNNRFVLRYVDKNAIELELSKEVIVSVLDKKITINSALTTIDKVVLYDMSGRKLFQKNKADANVFVIPNFVWNHQVLLVDVALSDGTKHTRKVVN